MRPFKLVEHVLLFTDGHVSLRVSMRAHPLGTHLAGTREGQTMTDDRCDGFLHVGCISIHSLYILCPHLITYKKKRHLLSSVIKVMFLGQVSCFLLMISKTIATSILGYRLWIFLSLLIGLGHRVPSLA